MLCEACTSRCYEHGTRDVDTRVLLMRRRRASRQLAVGSGAGSARGVQPDVGDSLVTLLIAVK